MYKKCIKEIQEINKLRLNDEKEKKYEKYYYEVKKNCSKIKLLQYIECTRYGNEACNGIYNNIKNAK